MLAQGRHPPPPAGPAAPEGLAQPHRCPQSWHSKGFSLVWVSMCRRRSFLFLEAKLHWLHWWGRRLECCAMWACGRGRGSAAQGWQLPAHQLGAHGLLPLCRRCRAPRSLLAPL